MITIDVNNDYGVQTGEFDITFTPINSTGNDMMVTAYIKDFNGRVLFHQDVTSGEEYSIHISKSQFEVWFNSVENKILLYAYASGEGTSEEYVSFMKLIMPELIISDHLGSMRNIQGGKSINLCFDVKDVISPTSQRTAGWNDLIGVLVCGIYLDDLEHLVPVAYWSNPALVLTNIYSHDSQETNLIDVNAQNISLGEHTLYIVYSMVRGDWDSSNPQNPWLYDNYAIVQKEVKVFVTDNVISWTNPKITWHGEPFNAVDYNRIKGNLLYLHDMADKLYDGKNLPDLGNNKTFADYYFANEFNAFEDELEDINERTLNLHIGEKQTFYPLGKFIEYEECNRIESAQVSLHEGLNADIVDIPYVLPMVYTGREQYPIWVSKYNFSSITMTGTTSATNVGTYTTILSLSSGCKWIDGTTEPKTVTWSIGRCPVYVPSVKGEYIFNRSVQNVELNPFASQYIDVSGDMSGTNVGTYHLTYHLNNANYEWVDGTTADKTDTWEIKARIIPIPYLEPYEYVYNGNWYEIDYSDIVNYDANYMVRTNYEDEINAGTYTFYISLRDTVNTTWEDGTITPITIEWTIEKANGRITLSTNTIRFDFSTQEVEVRISDYTGVVTAVPRNTDIVTVRTIGQAQIFFTRGTTTGSTIIDINVAESQNYKPTTATISATYEAVVDPLIVPRSLLAATRGFHATIGGGDTGNGVSDVVEYYSDDLYHGTFQSLSVARSYLTALANGDEVIFAGGQDGNGYAQSAVDIYNRSGTRSQLTSLSNARYFTRGAKVYGKLLFAGGRNRSSVVSRVDIYDTTSYTQTYGDDTDLRNAVADLGSASIYGYALFAGGSGGNEPLNIVQAYDESLTRSLAPELRYPTKYLTGGSLNNNAFFAGGQNGNSSGDRVTNAVEIYDTSLTKHQPNLYLQESVTYPAVANTANHIIFAGGMNYNQGGRGSNKATAYNDSYTQSILPDMTERKWSLAGVGTYRYQDNSPYALFVGGMSDINVVSDVVEIYNSNLQHAL